MRLVQYRFNLIWSLTSASASSRDESSTANEPTSVELLAVFNRVFRSYFRTVLRRDHYYGKVIQSHNVLPGNLSLCANK